MEHSHYSAVRYFKSSVFLLLTQLFLYIIKFFLLDVHDIFYDTDVVVDLIERLHDIFAVKISVGHVGRN